MKRRSLRIGASLGISAAFLWVAARGVDWSEAARALAEARYLAVVPMLLITVWTLLIRAQRWRLLLRPVGSPGLLSLVTATNIGFMANMVLPLRIGEVVRPVLVQRRERLPLSGLLATVILERIFDMFTILLLFGVAAAFVPVSEQVRAWGLRLTALAAMIGGAVVLIRWQERRTLAVVGFALRLAPAALREPAERFLLGFVQALEVLDSPGMFLRVLAWSLFLWLVITSIYAVGFYAFDLRVPVLLGSIAVNAVIAIAVSVPSAPGYVGAFQLGCILALGLFGVSEGRAMAYSIVLHGAQFVGVVGAGVYSLWTEGLSLQEIERVSEAPDVAA